MTQVLVRSGSYRNQTVRNVSFTLVKDYTKGARGGFVTVASKGYFGAEHDVVRVKVDSIEDIEIIGNNMASTSKTVDFKAPVNLETEEEAMARIR